MGDEPRQDEPSSDEGDLLGARDSNTLLAEVDQLDALTPVEYLHTTHAGLMHLGVAIAVLVGLTLVPYASPRLAMFQAWLAEDGVPIVRMFLRDQPAEAGMAVATGGASGRGSGAGAAASIADQLGDAVAANLGDEGGPARAQTGASETRGADQSGAGRTGEGEDGASGPRVVIAPSELEGLVRELEDPNDAMRPFYEALLETAERRDQAITRVAHYGDSSIAGDGITGTLRRRFQQRFGDAGHGFMLMARGTMPYRHTDVSHRASGSWRLIQLVRAGLREHTYGYGGVQSRSVAGATADFGASDRGPVGGSVSRFELWYQEHPRGGRVDLRVDDGERVVLSTRGDAVRDAWHTVEVPDGDHRLQVRAIGGGESRLYGMVLERDGPGVVYDSLGMVGARGRRMLGYDLEHFRGQHAHRGTNLIVLGFGGNDADDGRTPEQFEEDFRAIARFVRRARPEAACLLMAPLDQARRDERGGIETLGPVPIIVEAQRRAARAEGCAFFDTYAAMGGEGAMRRWFRSNPRLAFGDFRHATPAGYQVIGNMLYKALLKGFADFLARRAAP